MAKFVAKSPNSFLGGTSKFISGKFSDDLKTPSFIADSTEFFIASIIFSFICNLKPPLQIYKAVRDFNTEI